MSFDPELFGQAMGEAIRKAVEPLHAEIDKLRCELSALERLKDGKDGRDGRDGKDCDMDQVRAMIEDAVKSLPPPEPGKDGRDGKDGISITIDDATPVIERAIDLIREEAESAYQTALDAIPTPKDGKDGQDGADGNDGKSVTLDDMRPIIERSVALIREDVEKAIDQAVKAIPVPKDGRDGRDGVDGKDGEKGEDGISMADLLIDRDGVLVATYTDGRMKTLGQVVGRDGVDGKDGVDGIGLDNFELEYLPDTHEIAIKAQAGIRVKELRYPAGGIHPGGYWRDGNESKAAQAWTHEGCLWVARRNTKAAPSTQSDDWVLMARKGRDGERGPKGKDAAVDQPIKIGG